MITELDPRILRIEPKDGLGSGLKTALEQFAFESKEEPFSRLDPGCSQDLQRLHDTVEVILPINANLEQIQAALQATGLVEVKRVPLRSSPYTPPKYIDFEL